MTTNKRYDVIIIGGSYAGLSAAMALGRSLRNVVVIDSGQPCNQPTPHSHNFLTQDGSTPAAIATLARQQVEQYKTVHFLDDFATEARKIDNGFEITTRSGQTVTGKKLVLATGIKDQVPALPGFAECWGVSLVHCPYCHGYEFRGQPTAIMANGERAFHLAMLVSNLTGDVTLLPQGKGEITDEQKTRLGKHNIIIDETEITALEHENGQIKNVVFSNGVKKSFTAVYAALPFVQHSDIPASLGCTLTEQGHIKTDGQQKTTVPGVFACGDNTSPMRSVANAVYSGNLTGAVVNRELAEEAF